MNAPFYVKILEKQLLEVEKIMRDNWILQQDNDPKHTSCLAKNYLKENVSTILDWSSNSPDLNPIENLWRMVKRNVEKRKPKNLSELEVFIVEEWERILNEVYKKLASLMWTRCQQIIDIEEERINY
jgi:transposase